MAGKPKQKDSSVPNPAQWKEGLSDFQTTVALMKRMGSKNGYSPIPPPHHQWQRRKGNPPLYRIWSWLCDHTILWGHRSEYAVNKDGQELHIEHIAKDLAMDEGNVRRDWKEGVERGLWRNGTKAEGPAGSFILTATSPFRPKAKIKRTKRSVQTF